MGIQECILATARHSATDTAMIHCSSMPSVATDELSTEFCKAHLISAKRLNEGMENLGRFDPKPFPNADTEFDQCLGRLKKIVRVLAKRGVPEISVPALCKQTRSKPSS
jgi:hypothetical protein